MASAASATVTAHDVESRLPSLAVGASLLEGPETANSSVSLARAIGSAIGRIDDLLRPRMSGNFRDYIEKHLVDFARRNPATVVYVKPRRRRPPLIVAEYLCGNWQYVQASMMDCDEVYNWMELLRNRSGLDILPIYKKWSTKFPSIQGMWHLFYHDQTNDTRLLTPEEIVQKLDELSQPPIKEVTAEDRLIELSKKQQQRIDA
ncbi:unnamed protein product [Dicrocoelium dendriticum]|nr:unnamed protein product [Dicrocoelium dendriticum]